ncbi:hypothetical protein AAFF_G00429710 [Aldrovandia affinis]|uniref:Uncharacterized protein n=1 Tax=Aldrovandia affinis TaxID=143900 RepID=A0AAD7WIF4_9TELE|nr:hypothetical protein AAFF_G00429710 [Aldrovandia affinis]
MVMSENKWRSYYGAPTVTTARPQVLQTEVVFKGRYRPESESDRSLLGKRKAREEKSRGARVPPAKPLCIIACLPDQLAWVQNTLRVTRDNVPSSYSSHGICLL